MYFMLVSFAERRVPEFAILPQRMLAGKPRQPAKPNHAPNRCDE
jgi:hypothetical protein